MPSCTGRSRFPQGSFPSCLNSFFVDLPIAFLRQALSSLSSTYEVDLGRKWMVLSPPPLPPTATFPSELTPSPPPCPCFLSSPPPFDSRQGEKFLREDERPRSPPPLKRLLFLFSSLPPAHTKRNPPRYATSLSPLRRATIVFPSSIWFLNDDRRFPSYETEAAQRVGSPRPPPSANYFDSPPLSSFDRSALLTDSSFAFLPLPFPQEGVRSPFSPRGPSTPSLLVGGHVPRK